ncbi:tRNA pseudouridine synthase D [Perkinsela sp. CCAP 1560/4]|nr:tRNA pseudouridine synthase D [Perkinsela sp. CCAP 1560/4]|eukprot:KNH07303.1 tRNA pseudouridine synthase D [Perkinsela sp. CCAP 1560/4]
MKLFFRSIYANSSLVVRRASYSVSKSTGNVKGTHDNDASNDGRTHATPSLSHDKLFQRIYAEKFKNASVHLNSIKQYQELVFPEKDQWRELQTLPNDSFLDYETGRLRRLGDWGNRALIAQRERGEDFQINEVSERGKIQVYQPIMNEQLIYDNSNSKKQNILGLLLHCSHVDTVSAITKLSEVSNIPIERFHVQQLIDKTTVNTQRCTVEVDDMGGLRCWMSKINQDSSSSIRVQPITWTKSHLSYGLHKGNYSSVLLRHCKAPIRTIVTRTCALRDDGFVNYYPQKYFGYGTYGNQYVGMCVLRNNFSLALTMLAQDECESVKNRHPELGTHKGFYIKKIPWLKQLISCFATPSSDEEDYRSIYMMLPQQLRWKHLLGVRCYVWNLCASLRLQEDGSSKLAGDLIGVSSSGVSSLPADLFSDSRLLEVFMNRLPKATPSNVVLNNPSVHSQNDLRGVVLSLPCGGGSIATHREKQVCRELHIPNGNWNPLFGFVDDPSEEHRSLIAHCEEMSVHSIPEGYCEQHNIPINLRTDAQVHDSSKILDSSWRLSKELQNLGLSRNLLLGKWGRVGHKSHVLGFMSDRGTFIQSALRDILHLDRPFDSKKSLQNYMPRSREN